jgi:hypothetical protein
LFSAPSRGNIRATRIDRLLRHSVSLRRIRISPQCSLNTKVIVRPEGRGVSPRNPGPAAPALGSCPVDQGVEHTVIRSTGTPRISHRP